MEPFHLLPVSRLRAIIELLTRTQAKLEALAAGVDTIGTKWSAIETAPTTVFDPRERVGAGRLRQEVAGARQSLRELNGALGIAEAELTPWRQSPPRHLKSSGRHLTEITEGPPRLRPNRGGGWSPDQARIRRRTTALPSVGGTTAALQACCLRLSQRQARRKWSAKSMGRVITLVHQRRPVFP